MIKTTDMLLEELKSYANPKSKLSRMVKNGEVFPIVKGLYETDRNTPAHLLAGSIYGPSYISFEYALSFYGMIPEAVYTVTCATFEKKKKKRYETAFGTFTYRDIPSEAFPQGIRIMKDGDYYYRIATPEKALCDKLYTVKPVANSAQMKTLLLDDLRIDEDELGKLDLGEIERMAGSYHSTNITKLCTTLRRLRNERSN
ncbi:MAG: hypothetical protein LUG49_04635 [Oscillospiraceae bacterium]|nr:hypothetical protein [Oscillospiraceae bacterium]